MSGFFWNIRGFNKDTKHTVVRKWIKKHSFQFGCLLETRVKERKAERIIQTVFKNWSFISNYAAHRLGRIWVVWSPNVRITPCFSSGQMITCSILLEDAEDEFFCSFIYASNFVEERKILWEDIKNHQNSPMMRNKPWVLMGDFNEILQGEEHSNFDTSPGIPNGMRDFQEVAQYCSLMDMTAHGPLYTWCNKKEEGLICKKLDRALVSDAWYTAYPQSYCVFESGGCSDHMRGSIQIKLESLRVRRPFKFTNALTSLPGFLPLVESFWAGTEELFTSTSALYRFSKKLKSLKQKIKELSKEQFSDLQKQAKQAYDELCECQEKTMLNPSPINMEEEARAFRRWSLLSDLEERFLKQKAKVHWLEVGDGNNRYYHQAVKAREVRNAIREIQTSDGVILNTQEEIKGEAENYFHNFLSYKPEEYIGVSTEVLHELLGFECDEADGEMLSRMVSEEEVKSVLFAMAKNKSPGPDAYTCEFYKAAWPVVGKDFVVAIRSFFDKGFLPKGINTTILALIPKKEEAKLMKDYMPISCCNVLYKVISKILANRLKKILPKFISSNQSAFVKDRLLMENVLLASELVKNYHKATVSARCAVKIDIAKAFDSVQWPFLLSTLKALKIPEKFIHWISLCVTTASFSVQVNGELAGFFRSARGLRQGCALSPYLFVICMNVLSKMLDKAAAERNFGYHPYCHNLKLTHLCFADDLMIFSDGKRRSVEGILEVFQKFTEASGLGISMEKSTLYMAGVTEDIRDAILEEFRFETGSLPVRYLGLPLLTKRMTVTDYLPLLEKIRSRISCWTARSLSFAGRFQLIASVIHSLTNFWMSAFRLPKSCTQEIDKLCAAFLWSGPELNARKAKIAWQDVCKPKEEGGLGLRSLTVVNKVSSLKLIWRILSSSSSLWVDWIRMYLIRKGSLWSVKESSSLGSWMWKKLLKYRDLAASLTKVEVHSGISTSFWYDDWSPLGKLIVHTGFRGCIDLGIDLHASVRKVLQSHRRRRHRVEILNAIEDVIYAQKQHGSLEGADVNLWRQHENNYKPSFSSKHTWNQIRVAQPNLEWSKGVWFSYATPKYSFITWLAFHNRLSTGDRILTWNVGASGSCIFCDNLETRNHLFFSCNYTEEIWKALTRNLLEGKYTADWQSLTELLTDKTIPRLRLFLFRYVFQVAIHSIWRERNGRRHGEPHMIAQRLILYLDKQVRNRLTSIRRLGDARYEEGMQLWFGCR